MTPINPYSFLDGSLMPLSTRVSGFIAELSESTISEHGASTTANWLLREISQAWRDDWEWMIY